VPHLIDTDVIIDHLGGVPRAVELLMSLPGGGLFMSTVTFMEAFEGVLRGADSADTLQKLNTLVADVALVHFDEPSAMACAVLRADLRSRGLRVDTRVHDLMIAATALAHGLTVVTRNVRDYADLGVQLLPYS
jgi:tRNA(fMet)-specific endonuclease VapC